MGRRYRRRRGPHELLTRPRRDGSLVSSYSGPMTSTFAPPTGPPVSAATPPPAVEPVPTASPQRGRRTFVLAVAAAAVVALGVGALAVLAAGRSDGTDVAEPYSLIADGRAMLDAAERRFIAMGT